jgi:WD40 repeat protein
MSQVRVWGLLFALLFGFTSVSNAAPAPIGAETLTLIGQMRLARADHMATRLKDGRVLITGGMPRDNQITDTAEIFDPTTNQFSFTASMTIPRVGHTATLLQDGRVLIVGGWSGRLPVASAELYDPTTNTFQPTGSLSVPREGFTATLLQDGKVLIAGGDYRHQVYTSAELYDPKTGTFSLTGVLTTPRAIHTATRLADGRVLLAGGTSDEDTILDSAELYDPRSGTFSPTGKLMLPRYKHGAVLLPDGNVLIAGGSDNRDWRGRYKSAEIYDVSSGTFRPTQPMDKSRFKLSDAITLLENGQVLIAGGSKEVEVFDPQQLSFTPVSGAIDADRFYITATPLLDGRVLITGGYDYHIVSTAQAWIYSAQVEAPTNRAA